ncbi:MAG: hypothetical protein MJZ33_10670 [Paludibacteraceae bacterium]|nr:hypothetical protein [Paludibacteraceae bacterium]
MRKAIPTLVVVTILFGITAFFVGKVYKTGQDRPPLKYASIPTSTLDFLGRLIKAGGGITVNTSGGGSWNNEDDLGSKEAEEWTKEEDDFFIVYYHRDKEAIWQGRALDVLREAHKNIEILAELMGKYYYPADVNNRKLPIYLPNKDSEYPVVIGKLLGTNYPGDSSIGMTVCSISLSGCKTEGIVLRPCIFERQEKTNNYITTLRHEMHHYIYHTAIDYSKDIEYYNWQIEGLADFCCNRNRNDRSIYTQAERGIEYIKQRCFLTEDFPEESNAQYWAGEQFFYYLEETYGRDYVKKFIIDTYTQKTADVFHSRSINEEEEHEKWVQKMLQKKASLDSIYADISF